MNFDLLYTMLNTESVSGGEIPLQKKVAAYMRGGRLCRGYGHDRQRYCAY